MAIKFLVVFLGVTAMLWCMADAAVTLTTCTSDIHSITVTGLTVSGGYLPLAGGDVTIGGSLSVDVGTASVSEVNVKVNYARASISFITINLCDRDELSEYCADAGKTVTCNDFQELLSVSNLCSNGNFNNVELNMNAQTVTVPSITTLSFSGTASAEIQFKVGSTKVGCTRISIPIQ